jgi:hypothetical protein
MAPSPAENHSPHSGNLRSEHRWSVITPSYLLCLVGPAPRWRRPPISVTSLIGNLIARGAAAWARGWGVWGAGVAWRLMLALDSAYSHRRSDAFGPLRGVIPARREPVYCPDATWAQCTALIPAYSRPRLRMFRSGSGLPGQFGLTNWKSDSAGGDGAGPRVGGFHSFIRVALIASRHLYSCPISVGGGVEQA